MIQKDISAVVLVSIYFFIYALLLQFDTTRFAGFIMSLFYPVLLIWMVLAVLKHGKYTGRELSKDEFGYQDKRNDELGISLRCSQEQPSAGFTS